MQPVKPKTTLVVPMRRHDMYQHPDYPELGDLSREEFLHLRSRGPAAVKAHRLYSLFGDTHSKSPNWIAMHHTAERFGYKLQKITKTTRVYTHPEAKHTLRFHWNDPGNDPWSFEFGPHRHKHDRHEVCNVGTSNEDLATHLAQAATESPRWICQHALNRTETPMVRKHRFEAVNTPRFEHLVETRRSMYSRNTLSNASGMGSNPQYQLSARHVPRRYASHPRVHARTHPRPLNFASLYWAPGVIVPADVTGASPRQVLRYLHSS